MTEYGEVNQSAGYRDVADEGTLHVPTVTWPPSCSLIFKVN